MCLFAWGSSPRSRCPGAGSPGRGQRSGSRRSGCPALPALCRCLPFSSFKAAPSALAPGSLICRATPLLPPLPQPRRGGTTGTPGGSIPHPRPEHPGGSAGDGAAASAPAQLGRSPSEEVCWGGRCVCLCEWGC